MSEDRDAGQLEALLEFLRDERGFDFTGYKRPSLARRIERRMSDVGASSYERYKEHLETHPDEFPALFDTILINVTSFFREPQSWEFLGKEIAPRILETKSSSEPVRAWVVGCATGEEAYTLAIVLAEVMGEEAFLRRVKIYASDVDKSALDTARHGTYRAASMKSIPPEYRDKYFETSDGEQRFRTEYRRSVVFGSIDLVRDAPISRVDLITCRNTLMYFNAELQGLILARFHFALNDPGYLFLGRAEMLIRHSDQFVPESLRHRIFRKVPKAQDRAYLLGQPDGPGEPELEVLKDAALEADPYAQVLVTTHGRMALINDHARAMFGLQPSDLGRQFREVDISYRPVEMRGVIGEVLATGEPRTLHEVERALADGSVQYLDVAANPVRDRDGSVLAVVLTFLDVTENRRLKEDLQRSKQDLATAYDELESTNEALETTNEELQSTVEELETTNEELQSTNEELQTMNEELQSSNEELHTINMDMQERSDFLVETSALLDSMLRSFGMGVAIMGPDLDVRAWNDEAQELWGVRADEVLGQPLLSLDIGLPLDRIEPAIRRSLEQGSELEIGDFEATNRRGRTIVCSVRTMPLLDREHRTIGAMLIMEEKRAG